MSEQEQNAAAEGDDAVDAEVARIFKAPFVNKGEKQMGGRFEGLAKHLLRTLPVGHARDVALIKLRKTRDATLRAMRG